MSASRSARQEGFSLLEIMVTTAVLSLAACAMTGALLNGMTVGVMNRESRAAQNAARRALEEISGLPIAEAFARYDPDPADDPDGPATAAGPTFELLTSTGRRLQARVDFPTANGSELREDVDRPELGMPRDLNGDGQVDRADHAKDCKLLPVRLTVSWRGVTGLRSFQLSTVLVDR